MIIKLELFSVSDITYWFSEYTNENANKIVDEDRNHTMAMLIANTRIIPPKEFCHEPSLMTPKHNTVAMLLA